jgi:capsular exopolysaccharide synthesis family protein
MSRIFEALSKAGGEIFEALPSVLEEELPSREGIEHDTDASAVRMVLGGPEVSSPVPAVSAHLRDIPQIRERAIHLSGLASLLPFDNTNYVAAEQYRIIRTRLIQHPKQPRMILISSGGPGDGKSVTAVNVAGALSLKTEANVLLMDTDFRRSTIHSQLGLPATPGLSDVLSGGATLEEALIRTKQFPNLYVISAGTPCANPSELLDSTQWGTICVHLRSRFRYVIADSPPVASVADYELLQASCDGVVLVVRPDHTKRQACMKAIGTIPKDKLIGVVVNCVSDWFLARSDYSYYNSEGRGVGPKNEPRNLHS